jgi:translation elongation factor EF-4
MLIGNKIDLVDETVVTDVDINGFLEDHPDVRYFRTSASTGAGISEAVRALVMALPRPKIYEITPVVHGGKKWMCC